MSIKVETSVNRLDDDWWFELGITWQRTPYHREFGRLFSLGLGLFTIYFRW
jgi:hypothetical protein